MKKKKKIASLPFNHKPVRRFFKERLERGARGRNKQSARKIHKQFFRTPVFTRPSFPFCFRFNANKVDNKNSTKKIIMDVPRAYRRLYGGVVFFTVSSVAESSR